MAEPNGTDGSNHRRRHDDEQPDPERTQRLPATKGAVDRWFSDSDSDDRPQGGGR